MDDFPFAPRFDDDFGPLFFLGFFKVDHASHVILQRQTFASSVWIKGKAKAVSMSNHRYFVMQRPLTDLLYTSSTCYSLDGSAKASGSLKTHTHLSRPPSNTTSDSFPLIDHNTRELSTLFLVM